MRPMPYSAEHIDTSAPPTACAGAIRRNSTLQAALYIATASVPPMTTT